VDGTEQAEIRVALDPEIEQLLMANGTDVVGLLRSHGVDVRRAPGSAHGTGEKEPVTALLIGAGVLLAPLLRTALEELMHKKVLVEERVPMLLTDARGEVVRDAAGEPLVEWVERHRFVESSRAREQPSSAAQLLELHAQLLEQGS